MTQASLKTFAGTLFIIASVFCTIPSIHAHDSIENATLLDAEFIAPKPATPTYSQADADHLNRLYATWNAELNSLLSNIQHLAQLTSSQKITPSEPQEARAWLSHMSMLINKTSKLPYAPLTPHKLIRFFTFNKILIRSLTLAYNNNLNVRPAVEQLDEALEELSAALQTPTRTNLPISAVNAYALETQQAAAALAYKINNDGLTWYNNAWRSAHSINKTLHITDIALTTAAAAVTATAILYFLPPQYETGENAKNSAFGNLQQKVQGHAAAKGLTLMFNPQEDPYKRYMAVMAGIGGIGTLQSMGVFNYIGQKWSDVDAFLKGTTNDSYQNLIQYVDDLTLEDPMFDSVRHLFVPFDRILQFLKDPDYYLNKQTKPAKCVLLTGTSGSGKTHSARALAGSINKLLSDLGRYDKAGFIEVDPFEAVHLEEILKRARAHAPCVVFIDELHIFAGGAQINNNAVWLNKLLTELDKIDTSNDPTQQIFIVAATNRPELLEEALLRHGRFGERVEFPVPDFEQRKSVFNALSTKSALDMTSIDLDYLARLTQGSSFSTISKIFESANMLAKNQAQGVTQEHLYQGINQVLRGLNPHVGLSEYEKEVVATHLAGIALAYITLDTTQELDAITLQMPRRKVIEKNEFMVKMENIDTHKQHKAHYGTFFTYNRHEHIIPVTADRFVASKLLLAGVIAQNVMLGGESSYGITDRALAYDTALSTCLGGLKVETLSEKTMNDFKDKAFNAITQCEAELTKLFTEKKRAIRAIADELKKKEFLTVQEIKALLSELSAQ